MQLNRVFRRTLVAAALLAAVPLAASAQVKVGISVSATGPAASLGIPEQNTVALLPKKIGGETVQYIVLDDATDTTQAVKNIRKLTADDHVDVVLGSSVTPASLAMVDVAAETGTPMISLAASAKIVEPVDGPRKWAFKTPQNDALMAHALADAMAKQHIKTLGFIGFSDAYGDSWLQEMKAAGASKGIKIVTAERFARPDTSVTGQVLKLLAAHPDGILIAASGTPAALPQRELVQRGYKGQIYQTHGAANEDVLRVCGKACNGMILPAGPLLVASQLPDSNPVKKTALTYVHAYEAKYGAGSLNTFGGHMWDAGQLINAAIPVALKTGAKPGTPEFRSALRTALENVKELSASQGVFNMSPTDHAGLDKRGRVIVKVVNGKWVYQPDL
ncbi:MAG TPA: ABC transporter substrate-binding protein [Castellaniella sp.]|uniref:ABC transporter substrate-binding protein n=1 Tax=Castellaniella sp. TaxID=1955812 RepID=UPI002EFA346A